MNHWWQPGPLFNPVTAVEPLTRGQLAAGPLGLVYFLLAVPFVLVVARRWPRAALLGGGLLWVFLTTKGPATLVLLAALLGATAYLCLLHYFRCRSLLSERAMIAAVWIGLHLMVLPLWLRPMEWQWWYPSPMAALHNLGLAYFLLRFIAWGVDWAKKPGLPLRLVDTACWLLYPPIMRLGPVEWRERFFERLDAWNPRTSPDFAAGLRRFGLFLLGSAGVVATMALLPRVAAGADDFYRAPQNYSTGQLLAVLYLIPIQIYLVLWTYNEVAATLGCWIGLRVDNNFDWLPCATSVRDFWRRWHVTVGAWLRKYIYIPLGGNRAPLLLTYGAVFGYCSVWHGASWSFLVWGGSNVLALLVQKGWDEWRGGRGAAGQLTAAPAESKSRIWTVACWLITMQFQIVTIMIFTDFDYSGMRILPEIWRRITG